MWQSVRQVTNGLTKSRTRQLDDDELDEDDDVERTERVLREAEQDAEQEYVAQERITMDLEIPRQPIPEPSDGEVCVMKDQYANALLTTSRCMCSRCQISCR